MLDVDLAEWEVTSHDGNVVTILADAYNEDAEAIYFYAVFEGSPPYERLIATFPKSPFAHAQSA